MDTEVNIGTVHRPGAYQLIVERGGPPLEVLITSDKGETVRRLIIRWNGQCYWEHGTGQPAEKLP